MSILNREKSATMIDGIKSLIERADAIRTKAILERVAYDDQDDADYLIRRANAASLLLIASALSDLANYGITSFGGGDI